METTLVVPLTRGLKLIVCMLEFTEIYFATKQFSFPLQSLIVISSCAFDSGPDEELRSSSRIGLNIGTNATAFTGKL